MFATPWLALLTAAGAIAVPIVIHLLNRKRFRVVEWAAMRFLLAAQRQSVRRMRLEQIILLAVRCAMLLLLVLAMASVTPWAEAFWYKVFPENAVLAAAGTQRTHKIIVLDGSFSMALKTDDGSCFERARRKANDIIEASSGSDGFSVILMAAPPQRVVSEPSADPRKVSEEIKQIRRPDGNADLAATLQAVEDLVRRSPAKFEAREVYFLTDLQRSTWTGQTMARVAEKIQQLQHEKPMRLVFMDVGRTGRDRDPDNLAITHLTIGSPLAVVGVETPVTATLTNFSGEERRQVRVELLVGRARATAQDPALEMRVVRQEFVNVPPGRTGVTVALPHTFSQPGEYAVQVRVEHDNLEVDDARSLIVPVKDTLPVLLVNGKPANRLYEEATAFLDDALNPFGKDNAPRNSPLRTKVITGDHFADATLGDLTPYDCVFLCDVPQLKQAEVNRLETHLRRGGGIVFCLGPRVDLAAYNRLVYKNGEGLLPGPLVRVEQPEGKRAWALFTQEEEYKKPPLEPFLGDKERASLMRARFRNYVQVTLPTQGKARKVLAFTPEKLEGDKEGDANAMRVGDPAVIEFPRHRGRVIVMTSTANMDWNSWPGSPSYLVFIQELVRYAVAGRLYDQAVLVGDAAEEYLPAAAGNKDATVRTPDGRKVGVTVQARDEAAVLRFADTDQAGVYVATVGTDPREHLFAVNPPAVSETQQGSESDLTRIAEPELHDTYRGWDLQVVTDPSQVKRELTSVSTDGPAVLNGMGSAIALWLLIGLFLLLLVEVVLAWRLGHHTAAPANVVTAGGRALPITVGVVAGFMFLTLAGVVVHTVWTDDFLGFLPDRARTLAESFLGVPEPVAGESSHWRLEGQSPLPFAGRFEVPLLGFIALASMALIIGVYLVEGRTASLLYRMLLAGLVSFLVLIVVFMLLPRPRLWIERQAWPDVAIIIDDSGSMSAKDQYRDPRVKEAADKLAGAAHLSEPDRLSLAQALLTHPEKHWLQRMIEERKVKIRVYHCSGQAAQLADVTEPDQLESAVNKVNALPPRGDDGKNRYGETSQLGKAVREVLGEYRGSSLAAIVMLTDGVTTEGEDLVQAARHASRAGVPLFFVGLGDSHDARDLILHDLQVEDTVFVHDRLVFEARLTAQGYTGLPPVKVSLHEKDKEKEELASVMVTPDPQGKPVKFRLTYRPTKAEKKTYVLRVAEQPDEVDRNNNRLERVINVEEAKPSRVLYIEGYPRPEFRFLATLLERQIVEKTEKKEERIKPIQLSMMLLDAQDGWRGEDDPAAKKEGLPAVWRDFPGKEELNRYDVVILGDVDPKHPKIGDKNLKLLVDFVRERGGGLLLIAGKRNNPHSYKDTPLADVLPIRLTGAAPLDDPDASRKEGYRPALTTLGKSHPIFRFSPDEAENNAIWNKLSEIYWYAEGYSLQPAAEVLAVHPKQRAIEPQPTAGDDRHALAVQHFVGNGRCLFLGFDETWAWGFRDDVLRYNQFWVQTVHYLARSRLGRLDLRLDRTTPYRRGEPIKVTVRFPDDAQPPKEGTKVQVLVQRRALHQPAGPVEEKWTLQLAKVEGSRGTFEALQTPTPAGQYTFTLAAPLESTPPRAECRVLPPPDEMERLRMNQPDMERAADETGGKFYTLADADKLFEDLPTNGGRVTLKTARPPYPVWSHFLMFGLVLGLMGTVWGLRKRRHLL